MKNFIKLLAAYIAGLVFGLLALDFFRNKEKGEEFTYPSEPSEGTEYIIVLPIEEVFEGQRLVHRLVFRYQQGHWIKKETSITDYDNTVIK